MLTAPEDLAEGALAEALELGWGLRVAKMGYLPVGWGSHHWEVAGGGGRWFVTVDEVANKRLSEGESLDDGFGRLRTSLRAAAGRERRAGAAAGRAVRRRRLPVHRRGELQLGQPLAAVAARDARDAGGRARGAGTGADRG